MSALSIDALEQALEQRTVVLVIGNDLPARITWLPARAQLAPHLAERLDLDPALSFVQIMELAEEQGRRDALIAELESAYSGDDPGYFQRALAGFSAFYEIQAIITTTVDHLLERAFQERGEEVATIFADADLDGVTPGQMVIYRINGSIDATESLIFTAGERRRWLEDPDHAGIRAEIRRLVQDKTLLIYGFDLSAADNKALFTEFLSGSGQSLGYAVWEDLQAGDEAFWRERGIAILPYDPFSIIEEPMEAMRAESPEPELEPDVMLPKRSTTDGERRPALELGFEEGFDDLEEFSYGIGEEASFEEAGAEPRAASTPEFKSLRIDAAVPEQVLIDDPFVLAVAIRQPASPPLSEADLPVVHSGDAQVVLPDEGPVRLRVQVNAPECTFDSPDHYTFRLFPDADSPTFYFHLTPTRTGVISIIVQLFQEDEWLGGARISTRVADAPAGEVNVQIVSQPAQGTVDPATRQRIQEISKQLDTAKRLLAKLEEQLALMPPGFARATLELQIEDKNAEIKALEQELDELMAEVQR